jgi:hypothetical protein
MFQIDPYNIFKIAKWPLNFLKLDPKKFQIRPLNFSKLVPIFQILNLNQNFSNLQK